MALRKDERGNFQRQINEVKDEVNKKADKKDVPEIPAAPDTGTFVLTATDGVLSWEEQA